jgi:hypothetical protein
MLSPSRRLPAALATLALVLLVPLVAWNLFPGAFPARAHDGVAALPLALIAVTYLLHQRARGAAWKQLAQACLLATGFLLWAATQLWPDFPHALRLNDVAIVLFVSELYLSIARRPASPAEEPD